MDYSQSEAGNCINVSLMTRFNYIHFRYQKHPYCEIFFNVQVQTLRILYLLML